MPLSSVVGASSILKPGVCTSSTRPAAPYEGQTIYETDTDLIKTWNGSSWITIGPTTPAVSSVSQATVATSQSTSSTSYTDLTTSGPSVTVTTGTSALVIMSCYMSNAGGANSVSASMGFAVSGATTVSAADTARIFINTVGANGQALQASAIYPVTLTAGSNTFTAKYKAGAAQSVTFSDRFLAVIGL